jgi:hypothetical protein
MHLLCNMGIALSSVLQDKVFLRAGCTGFVAWAVSTCTVHTNLLTDLGVFLQLNGKKVNIPFDAPLASLWLILCVFSLFGSRIYGSLLTGMVPKYSSNN